MSRPNSTPEKVRVDAAIAQILKAEGVEWVIGYPVNPLFEAAAELDIRTVVVRQERTGLHMADAVSRLSSGEKIGVFIMQHGPGAENSYGAVAQAFSESVPVLVIPAGYPRRYLQSAPNFLSTREMRGVTKSAELLFDGKYTTEVFRRAFTAMRSGRPGPALVEVPLDVFGQTIDPPQHRPTKRHRLGPDPAAVRTAAAAIAAARRPVLYAGQGVHYAKAWPQLLALAERLRIPVATSLEGKSAFPEDHPLSLGSGGRALPGPLATFLQEADLIIGIGCSFTYTFFGIDFRPLVGRAKFLHSTLDPADIDKDLPADFVLLGDAQLVLQALLDEFDGPEPKTVVARSGETTEKISALRTQWLKAWSKKLRSRERPITPYRVISELMKLLDPADVIITHDAGSPRDQLSPFWVSTEPLSYLGWGKTTQLGYGLGLAMGAKLAQPNKICINVWGDAAIGFTGMDFETAVRERLPILSILFNNSSMAIEVPIMPVSTLKYRATDISGHYADFARAMGGFGERIEDPRQIRAALERGVDATMSGQPALLEFITGHELALSTGMS